jgi:hypothetical protein
MEISESEQKKISLKKNIVLRHKMIDVETKDQYWSLLENLKVGKGILTMDFKENITLGRGQKSLGRAGTHGREEQSLGWCFSEGKRMVASLSETLI